MSLLASDTAAERAEPHKKNMDGTKQGVQKRTKLAQKTTRIHWRAEHLRCKSNWKNHRTVQEVMLRWLLDLIMAQQSHSRITCTEIPKIIRNQSNLKIKIDNEKETSSLKLVVKDFESTRNLVWKYWQSSSSSTRWQSDNWDLKVYSSLTWHRFTFLVFQVLSMNALWNSSPGQSERMVWPVLVNSHVEVVVKANLFTNLLQFDFFYSRWDPLLPTGV